MRLEHELTPIVEKWLKGTKSSPYTAQQSVSKVMSDLSQTPQRRSHRWSLPWRKSSSSTSPEVAQQDLHPAPIPANNGHVPTVIGRTQTMLSPVKAITAGALVFALGSLFLVAQPFDQQGSVPGAEEGAELAPAVKATITVTRGTLQDEGCTDGSGNALETCTCDAPEICTWIGSSQWSATDPRLSGTETTRATEQWWPHGGDRSLYPVFEAYATEVVNDKGRWVGTARGTGPLGGLWVATLTGEGEYDGLTAVVTQDYSDSDDDGITTNMAVIIEGELPPFPDPIE